MIRYDVEIRLAPLDDARPAVAAHHAQLAYTGDSFLPRHQLDATHRRILVDGSDVGVLAYTQEELTLLTVAASAKRYDRQIVQQVLHETGIRHAYAASWDAHHVDLFGSFASDIIPQAYQFDFPEPPRKPIPGLRMHAAAEADMPYLERAEFHNLPTRQLRIAELGQAQVGIGVAEPHALDPSTVDIGMFADPDRRRTGIGRSIIALLANQVSDSGRRPVAGCWWRNWASRRTLESAGMRCVGTIFRLTLDPERFRG